jgi:PadR family transcriptional regulator, regulatory protein PadR
MTSQQGSLGEFEHLVLLALARRGDDAFGVDICDEIRTTAGRDASVPAVYVTLTRLEAKGLVESHQEEGETERGRRARKRFRLVRAGVEALEHSRAELDRMWSGVVLRPQRGRS